MSAGSSERTEPSSNEIPLTVSTMPETSALRAANLHMEFGGVHAVEGVSFAVEQGGTVGLIGPNGAGKSTVVSVLAGGLKPTSGTVRFDGHDIAGVSPVRAARLGLIRTFQLSSQFSRLTVMENLLVGAQKQRGESFGGMLLGKRYWGRQEGECVARARDLLRSRPGSAKSSVSWDLTAQARALC